MAVPSSQTLVNIGMHCREDNRWVTQHCALFCVLNSAGQVLTWKLTSSIKFAHCADILCNLHARLIKHDTTAKEFVVDLCCSWRHQLQGVFGADLTVLLDLFHATQRVLAKIPKRHKMRAMCVADFRLVFRDPADQGIKRTKLTPAPGTHCARKFGAGFGLHYTKAQGCRKVFNSVPADAISESV